MRRDCSAWRARLRLKTREKQNQEFTWGMLLAVLCTILLFPTKLCAGERADAFLAGYVSAVLEREFHVSGDFVQVQDGVVQLPARELAAIDPARVTAELSQIRGVTRVKIQTMRHPTRITAASAPRTTQSSLSLLQKQRTARREWAGATGFLPPGLLFAPLLADPRWPHFAATYRYYLHDQQLEHVGAADFGETIALYRANAPFHGQWEVGIQAAVFSLFALDTESADLVNADYFVALPLSYRSGDFSALARLLHQSSHLGDEFLLHNRVRRINLSYQALDLLLSYDVLDIGRFYGGGGYRFAKNPSDLGSWTIHYGVEGTSPWTLAGGMIQPIAGADFLTSEEKGWSTRLSIRAGLEFKSWQVQERKLQLLVEYLTGHSPNGQFFRRQIDTIGLGLHLQF